MEMNLKLDILVDINPETKEVKVLSINDIKVNNKVEKAEKTPKVPKVPKVDKLDPDSIAEPTLFLENGKYQLNKAALAYMNVQPEDRIDIKYKKVGKLTYPVIGTDENFGTKTGNKLTKSNTVSLRGVKHEKLSEYGTRFTLVPFKEDAGLFVLMGNDMKLVPEEPIVEYKDEIKVKEDDDLANDLPETELDQVDDTELIIDLDELTL